ncbi:gamma-glutamylcyclotransferase-like [Pectinophora gossypiella]|uniref:gamma-glutamylcyclotransferase n=1 Tax=Pectinophora gossypiella TaxID=13191 RepID=A0A1E1WEN0_PECGO|nr:gamma-glutamylcyclotransferase-like [Pectinophora gossypiella]
MNQLQDTFLYFAYGSNLLKKRIHINNPSAEFLGTGKLENHQLDFIRYTDNWGGCSATIVPTEGAHVWGAVWRVNNKDMPALDKQEGVESNWYFPKIVEIVLPEGTIVECRTYQQSNNPPVRGVGEDIPDERKPSKTYMEVIIHGAMECDIPEYYIEKLKKIPHNGKEASPEMLDKLRQ